MRYFIFTIIFILITQSMIQSQEILNPDFEEVKKEESSIYPIGWNNPNGNGTVVTPGYNSEYAIEVTGNGNNDSAWHSQKLNLDSKLYEFSFWGKALPGTQGGLATSGPLSVNRDFQLTEDWKRYSFVFQTPDHVQDETFRVGQWRVDGTLVYDNINLIPVQPVYSKQENLKLGDGEKINGKQFSAKHIMDGIGSNSCRFLQSTTANFNSNRWLMNQGSEVIYRHEIPEHTFIQGDVLINLNYHTSGNCRVLVRSNKIDWSEIGILDQVSSKNIRLPKRAFPAKYIEIKLVGEPNREGNCNFQINQYHFNAECDVSSESFQGRTEYARTIQDKGSIDIDIVDLGNPMPKQTTNMQLLIKNNSSNKQPLEISIVAKNETNQHAPVQKTLEPNEKMSLSLPYKLMDSGETKLQLIAKRDDIVLSEMEIPMTISYLYDADYGATLSRDDHSDIWWCPATYKISQERPSPINESNTVKFSAARGEFEPVQVVIRPKQKLNDVAVIINDFVGPVNTILSAEHFSLKQVEYVRVENPSDEWGEAGWWPDPLPPINHPLQMEKDRNYPLWITVKVPHDTTPGIYEGIIQLKNESWQKEVSVQLQVYNFEIPKKFNLRTAFGFSVGNVKQYHNLEKEEEIKEIIDLYYQNFRDHRISPYNPMQLYPIQADIKDGQFVFDFGEFKTAAKRYFDEFGFNSLRLPLLGMGGGTFHSRHKGQIGGYEAGSEEYERLFGQYASSIEQFLQENGWLDEAYVYWFDEPTPKDYDFVREGMGRIKRHAPGLQRMLTEQPEEELFGYVDIWCPILNHYDEKSAHARQDKGEDIWWYVCTGPKQPYPGLFIDHPAVDMRLWLWMTHKYDVEGCLVWQTNYWSSSAAFPDTPQDPWEDPMSYVSGYGRPAGYIGYWGNGDGRFIYPPKNWRSGEKIMSGPVDSIRWELLREGIEDYEYFYLIQQALEDNNLSKKQKAEAEDLLEIPDSIVESRTEYTKDAQPLYQYREKLAEFLESIQ